MNAKRDLLASRGAQSLKSRQECQVECPNVLPRILFETLDATKFEASPARLFRRFPAAT